MNEMMNRLPSGMHFKCDFIPAEMDLDNDPKNAVMKEKEWLKIEMELCRDGTVLWEDILDRKEERWRSGCRERVMMMMVMVMVMVMVMMVMVMVMMVMVMVMVMMMVILLMHSGLFLLFR